jgi:transposase
VDHEPRPGVRPKKSARDRLIRLAQRHPAWALGFCDETWWSRLARPTLHTWTEPDQPLRLVEQTVAKSDPDPKALACYGLLRPDIDQVWLRFVDGRPISSVTTQFLDWCLERLAAEGKTALLLVWDNASWHVSAAVRTWIRTHNRRVKTSGEGVRIVSCYLPVKSPWLNNIEGHWVHGKRNVVEADRLLSARELADRVCAHFHCTHEPHLMIPAKVA